MESEVSEMIFVLGWVPVSPGWVLCPLGGCCVPWVPALCQSLHLCKAPVGTKPYLALSPPEFPAVLSPKNRQVVIKPPLQRSSSSSSPAVLDQARSVLGTAGGALTQPLAVLEGLVDGVAGGAVPVADPTPILHRVRVDLVVTAHVLQESPVSPN